MQTVHGKKQITCKIIYRHYIFQILVLFHLWITWPHTRQSLPFGQRIVTYFNWSNSFSGIRHIVCKTHFNVL